MSEKKTAKSDGLAVSSRGIQNGLRKKVNQIHKEIL